jgi:hypothetical protein
MMTTPDEPTGYIVVRDLPALVRIATGDHRTTTERLDQLASSRVPGTFPGFPERG